jgi:hypothetical protein
MFKQKNQRSKSEIPTPIPPNFPQHQLPEPYARLLTLGDADDKEVYIEIANQLEQGDLAQAAQKLIELILDETFYDYYPYYKNDEEYFERETRYAAPLHALRTLAHLGEAACAGIEPLIPLFDSEDDWLREELPFYYAAMGQPAVAPLMRLVQDTESEDAYRYGAVEALQEIGEQHEPLREEIVAFLEKQLEVEEDPSTAAFLIASLMDLGAQHTYATIELAFREDRVDDFIVGLPDVQKHFGMPVTAQYRGSIERVPNEPELPDAPAPRPAPQQPYVSAGKVGRNELCPCGSGKKYKKCHGA